MSYFLLECKKMGFQEHVKYGNPMASGMVLPIWTGGTDKTLSTKVPGDLTSVKHSNHLPRVVEDWLNE